MPVEPRLNFFGGAEYAETGEAHFGAFDGDDVIGNFGFDIHFGSV